MCLCQKPSRSIRTRAAQRRRANTGSAFLNLLVDALDVARAPRAAVRSVLQAGVRRAASRSHREADDRVDQLASDQRRLRRSPRNGRFPTKKSISTRSSRASTSRCVCSGNPEDSSAAAIPRRTASSAASSSSTTICRPDLRRGIFAEPRTYRAWVRFSGPGPYVTPDIDDVGFMSISIKLMGVPGPKLMDDETVHAGHVRRVDADLRHAGHQCQRAVADRELEERAGLVLSQLPSVARPRLHHAGALDQDAEQSVRSAVFQLRAVSVWRRSGHAVLGVAEIDASGRRYLDCRYGLRTTTCGTPW